MSEVKMKIVGSAVVSEAVESVMEQCIAASEPALLIGETGTGKTTIIRELAKKRKVELHRVSVNGSTGVEEILGKFLAKGGSTVWQDGILIAAMKKGDWVVFDEINAALPEILFALHSLLDDDRKVTLVEKDNEVVRPHENFRFFATMNPTEEYAGTKELNKAFMSRFAAILNIPTLSEADEHQLLTELHGVESNVAYKLVQLGTTLRKFKSEEKIFYFCSTRDLVHAGNMSKKLAFEVACQVSVFNKMSGDEREIVKSAVGSIMTDKSVVTRTYKELVADNEKYKAENTEIKSQMKSMEDKFVKMSSDLMNEIMKKVMAS